jgi:hypothetical protein
MESSWISVEVEITHSICRDDMKYRRRRGRSGRDTQASRAPAVLNATAQLTVSVCGLSLSTIISSTVRTGWPLRFWLR